VVVVVVVVVLLLLLLFRCFHARSAVRNIPTNSQSVGRSPIGAVAGGVEGSLPLNLPIGPSQFGSSRPSTGEESTSRPAGAKDRQSSARAN